MAAPAAVNQITQLGVESVYGTAVAANRKIPGWSITPGSRVESQSFTSQGFKNPTQRPISKLWANGAHGGPLDFNSFLYVIASLVGVTGPTGAGAAKTWAFSPATSGPDTTKSYTVMRGEAAAAQRFDGTKVTSLTMTATQDAVNVGGNVISRFPTDGISLTASPTSIAARPVIRNMIDVFIDPDYVDIGTTKITDVYEETLAIADKDVPFWVHNTDYTSFKELVEQAHDLTMTLKTAHNAQSRAQFALISSNVNQYIRWKAESAVELETGINELIQIDMAGTIIGAEPMYNDGGVYGYQYQFGLLHDSDLGGAWEGQIINALTAL